MVREWRARSAGERGEDIVVCAGLRDPSLARVQSLMRAVLAGGTTGRSYGPSVRRKVVPAILVKCAEKAGISG